MKFDLRVLLIRSGLGGCEARQVALASPQPRGLDAMPPARTTRRWCGGAVAVLSGGTPMTALTLAAVRGRRDTSRVRPARGEIAVGGNLPTPQTWRMGAATGAPRAQGR